MSEDQLTLEKAAEILGGTVEVVHGNKEIKAEPQKFSLEGFGGATPVSRDVQPTKADVAVGPRGVVIDGLDSLWRFAGMVHASGFAPQFKSREAIAIAIECGLELGMTPMAALQNIAVINGRPGPFGDACLALVRASGLLADIREVVEGEGEKRAGVCETRRKGSTASKLTIFSVADAKRAHLWGKQGPWTEYPDRMLMFRARGWNLRDNFGDVLKGFYTAEELRDIPTEQQTAETAPAEVKGSRTEQLRATVKEKLKAAEAAEEGE